MHQLSLFLHFSRPPLLLHHHLLRSFWNHLVSQLSVIVRTRWLEQETILSPRPTLSLLLATTNTCPSIRPARQWSRQRRPYSPPIQTQVRLALGLSLVNDLPSGHPFSSVQWTKLPCPSTSSSPPLSSPSGLSIPATTSTALKPPSLFLPFMSNPIVDSAEPLDTFSVAHVVRQILTQNNIGQRIFARYILSLSQGTVSELLSKPKSWSKLTEKGKESYRKMWAWANSPESVLALKSISPRKGTQRLSGEGRCIYEISL